MPSSALETRSYVYDSSWGDLLTKYNGKAITYDGIGNMLTYNGASYTWTGRELRKITNGSNTYSYKYNADGIRTSKTVNGTTTEFFLNGSQVLAQKTGDSVMRFFYDSAGKRVGFANGTMLFYYLYNVQGDVIAIVRAATGQVVAKYSYDAWGNCTVTNATGYAVGDKNPFRYRGYYYDTETGLYYLNSRYYNPEFGRFISADIFITTDIHGTLNANMFAYCGNNPVMRVDPTGELFGTISGTIIGGLTGALSAYLNGGNIWAGALTGALNGGLCGFIADSTAFTGGAAILVCGAAGMLFEGINQSFNGTKFHNLDWGSIVLNGAFSALSCGFSKGVEKVMTGAPQTDIDIVNAVRGTSTSLVGVGVSNIHNQNQQKRQSPQQAANMERWKHMTEYYRKREIK